MTAIKVSVHMCVHVYMRVHALFTNVHVCTCVHVVARDHSMSSLAVLQSYFLRHGISENLELIDSVRLSCQGPGTLLSLPPEHWDFKHVTQCLAFYMGAED